MNLLKSFVVIALVVAMVTAKLPTAFEGHWEGIPDNTVVGPWSYEANGLFHWHVLPVTYQNQSGWLIEDIFAPQNHYLTGTVQQFWALTNTNETTGATTGTLRYCGSLRSFYKAMEPEQVTMVFELTQASENQLVWSAQTPWACSWTMTLSDGGKLLNFYVEIGSPVVHFNSTFKRSTPAAKLSPVNAEDVVKQPTTAKGASPFPAPCNMTSLFADDLNTAKDKVQKFTAARNAARKEGKKTPSLCPYGYTEKDGPMPDFVKKSLGLLDKQEEPKQKNVAPRSFIAGGKQYKNCYTVNTALNMSVRWNWNTDTEAIDVVMSVNPPASQNLNPNNAYVAVGILPNWPAMQGMDIVLGYFANSGSAAAPPQGCVRSLYAEGYIGMPVENNNQTITNTAMWTEGNTLYVQFTRPWNTGNHNIAKPPAYHGLPSISWALGSGASTCDGYYGYHGNQRGTFGFDWENPEQALPNNMKCKQ